MTETPEPLKCRLGECRDFCSELRRHGILHSHVRPVATSSAQGLPGQERFRSHPVCIVRSDEGAIHVTTRQRRGSRRLDPQYRPPDQSLRQRSEVFRLEALQASSGRRGTERSAPLSPSAPCPLLSPSGYGS